MKGEYLICTRYFLRQHLSQQIIDRLPKRPVLQALQSPGYVVMILLVLIGKERDITLILDKL